MRRVISLLVLALSISGSAAARLHPPGQIRDAAARDRPSTSPGASGWHQQDHQAQIPVIEAQPVGSPSLDRAAPGRPSFVRLDRMQRLRSIDAHFVRPHDPSHLHSYTLLI